MIASTPMMRTRNADDFFHDSVAISSHMNGPTQKKACYNQANYHRSIQNPLAVP
jgi:hypothetical protein